MSSPILTFIGWSIVPSLATRFSQSVYYGISIRAGDPKPAPGSQRFIRDYSRIQVTLIIAYLLYTIYEASHVVREAGDFYQDLGVFHNAEDRGIKSKFRRLAAVHHPDKLGVSPDGKIDDAYFVHLKLAQDTLLNPARRFAYDRFGPDVLTWQRCSTYRDYLTQGFWKALPHYFGSLIMLVVLGATGYLQFGKFWRYFLVLCLMALELYTTTRPQHPSFLIQIVNPVLTRISTFPPLLPYQFLTLLRSVTFTVFVALSQLGPHLQRRMPPAPGKEIDPTKLARIEHLAKGNENEANRLLELEFAPYADSGTSLRDLKNQIRQWLVQNTLQSDVRIRSAINEALKDRAAPVAGS